jgi:hypothetical protein
MRVIKQDAPGDKLNQGTVIFHAGGNIAGRWGDFQQFSEADQSYFDQLLPLEGLDPNDGQPEREYSPRDTGDWKPEVRQQSEIELEEIQLLRPAEEDAIRLLKASGIIPDDFDPATQSLKPIAVTKVAKRQAARDALNELIQVKAGSILKERKVNPGGHELDHKHLGKANFAVVISALHSAANAAGGKKPGERSDMSQGELDTIRGQFDNLVKGVIQELFDGH